MHSKRPRVTRALGHHEELKMVLCINNSLGMGKGKMGRCCMQPHGPSDACTTSAVVQPPQA